MNITHIPLESYQGRYTADLADVENRAFTRLFSKVTTHLPPESPDSGTLKRSASVLGSYRRPSVCLDQMSRLILALSNGNLDPVYFSDFYTTGLDALAYMGAPNKLYSFLWAQTADYHDFTYKDDVRKWMRPWERMALSLYSRVFVASSELHDRLCVLYPEYSHKFIPMNGALPYETGNIRSRYGVPFGLFEYNSQWSLRPFMLAFTSRWTDTKNPEAFLQLLEVNQGWRGVVLGGAVNTAGLVNAHSGARKLIEQGRLSVYGNLSRRMYFDLLQQVKFQFNGAYQDWVSFTLLDALTCGCVPIYPNYRSFPEAFGYCGRHLLYPGNMANVTASESQAAIHQIVEAHHEPDQAVWASTSKFAASLLSRCASVMSGIANYIRRGA